MVTTFVLFSSSPWCAPTESALLRLAAAAAAAAVAAAAVAAAGVAFAVCRRPRPTKQAEHRRTGKPFALKMIEKAEVSRLKRRHENVYNEIYMEKRALTKLSHPNIVRMHSTFQDYSEYAPARSRKNAAVLASIRRSTTLPIFVQQHSCYVHARITR